MDDYRLLRRAATLMREDAEVERVLRDGDPYYLIQALPDGSPLTEMSKYEMRWHPSVAVAVANWLDAKRFQGSHHSPYVEVELAAALTVARAYLKEGDDA